ncbi:MAG TPA: aminotransferase class V-fold PLP-dependent enzyme [Thermomicrobiales bacterium]|nr:aminotransferase class V-fold PLP-dependent enzyme [Thermomicrobiales bacterium]
MSVYDQLGVTTVINASGTLTRLGGSRMAPEVLAAMTDAAASFVRIDELQHAAGAVIADITGAEAGYVTAGAAAGLSLGMAAILAGMDVGKMDRLPNTAGMKNEVIVQRGHRNAYDHALRAAGITFVEVGYLGYPGAGGTMPWQIEEAITERTAAIACPILDTPGTLPLPQVAKIAHAHELPVIVDAAASLPPRANLRRFIAEGADLVSFSGGKAIGGPQASGVLAGRRDLIDSVALQHQDMDVRAETWFERGMLQSGALAGVPHQGFGRSMKVGREEVVGLVTALQRFAAGDDEQDLAAWNRLLDIVEDCLGEVPDVQVRRDLVKNQCLPLLRLDLDEDRLGFSAYDALNQLLGGDPAIAVAESRAEFGTLMVNPHGLREDEAATVGRRLREVLHPHSAS